MVEEKNKKNLLEVAYQITILLFTIVPVYFLFVTLPREITIQALIIFGVMIGVFIISIIFSFIYSKYKEIFKGIEDNKTQMEDIKKDLNFKDLFNKMDVRLGVVEKLLSKKGKRGSVDPRVIFWIILLILLLLFLKSIGVI